MFALIGAALFLGCPTDAGDGGGGALQDEGGVKPSAADQAKGLEDSLKAREVTVSRTGAKITLGENLDLDYSLTVPEGVTVVVDSGFKLTVKEDGRLAVSRGGVLAPANTAIEVKANGSFENAGTVTLASNLTVEGVLVNTGTITVPSSGKIEVKTSGAVTNSGVINAEGAYTVDADATLGGTGEVNLTTSTGIYTVGAGLTVTGTVTLEDSASLVLGTTDSDFAGINGTVKVSLTTISGEWITTGTNTGTVTIAAPGGAGNPITTITAASSATGLKASGAGGTITQQSGANNSLSIAADTVIELGGDGTTPLGVIRLVSGTDPAKLTLTASSTVKVGKGTGGTAIDGTISPKIDGKTIVITDLQKEDFKNDTTLVILGGTTAGNFTASTVAGKDVVIDSTVEAEGSAA
jgi:hypothetical protein